MTQKKKVDVQGTEGKFLVEPRAKYLSKESSSGKIMGNMGLMVVTFGPGTGLGPWRGVIWGRRAGGALGVGDVLEGEDNNSEVKDSRHIERTHPREAPSWLWTREKRGTRFWKHLDVFDETVAVARCRGLVGTCYRNYFGGYLKYTELKKKKRSEAGDLRGALCDGDTNKVDLRYGPTHHCHHHHCPGRNMRQRRDMLRT